MRASLQERCEEQIRNEVAVRQGHMLEFDHVLKLGAMLYTNKGCAVDQARIKECKQILKSKSGIFSNFRGSLEYIVLIKMALADDPTAYIDDVMSAYGLLKAGRKLPGEMMAMAATTIVDNCPPELRNQVIAETIDAYAKVKSEHLFLTDESDMSLIALMIMAGKDPDQAAAQAEEIFETLKGQYRIGSDVAQTASMVLALSDKPVDQKVDNFIRLFEACKAAGHATSKSKEMAIYAAYADLDVNYDEIVAEIGEVDLWLKQQKGYGMLGVGASMRRLIAATLVLEDRQGTSAVAQAGAANAVVQAIVEELVLILIMIIITCVIISTSSSSH